MTSRYCTIHLSLPLVRLPGDQELPRRLVPEGTEALGTLGKQLVEVGFDQVTGPCLIFRPQPPALQGPVHGVLVRRWQSLPHCAADKGPIREYAHVCETA